MESSAPTAGVPCPALLLSGHFPSLQTLVQNRRGCLRHGVWREYLVWKCWHEVMTLVMKGMLLSTAFSWWRFPITLTHPVNTKLQPMGYNLPRLPDLSLLVQVHISELVVMLERCWVWPWIGVKQCVWMNRQFLVQPFKLWTTCIY